MARKWWAVKVLVWLVPLCIEGSCVVVKNIFVATMIYDFLTRKYFLKLFKLNYLSGQIGKINIFSQRYKGKYRVDIAFSSLLPQTFNPKMLVTLGTYHPSLTPLLLHLHDSWYVPRNLEPLLFRLWMRCCRFGYSQDQAWSWPSESSACRN